MPGRLTLARPDFEKRTPVMDVVADGWDFITDSWAAITDSWPSVPDSWAFVIENWRLLLPIGLVGVVSWSVWAVRKLLSMRYRPTVNEFHTTTSVVVPSYREDPDVLEACLDTWLAENPDQVVIVLDVADTEAQQRLIARNDPRLHVIMFVHQGKRSALGIGIRAATAEVVVLTDSDTRWVPGLLAAVQMPFIDPMVGAVGTRQNVFEPNTSVWRRVADWIIDNRCLDYVPATGRTSPPPGRCRCSPPPSGPSASNRAAQGQVRRRHLHRQRPEQLVHLHPLRTRPQRPQPHPGQRHRRHHRRSHRHQRRQHRHQRHRRTLQHSMPVTCMTAGRAEYTSTKYSPPSLESGAEQTEPDLRS